MSEAKIFDSYKDSVQARHLMTWVRQHGEHAAAELPAGDNMNSEAGQEGVVAFTVPDGLEWFVQRFLSIRF